jgi:hypothetical protein
MAVALMASPQFQEAECEANHPRETRQGNSWENWRRKADFCSGDTMVEVNLVVRFTTTYQVFGWRGAWLRPVPGTRGVLPGRTSIRTGRDAGWTRPHTAVVVTTLI